MGISVLEGALLKLSSVIIPHSINEMHCNNFSYIQDTKGFCLGWQNNQIEELGLKSYKLKEIIDDIYQI